MKHTDDELRVEVDVGAFLKDLREYINNGIELAKTMDVSGDEDWHQGFDSAVADIAVMLDRHGVAL